MMQRVGEPWAIPPCPIWNQLESCLPAAWDSSTRATQRPQENPSPRVMVVSGRVGAGCFQPCTLSLGFQSSQPTCPASSQAPCRLCAHLGLHLPHNVQVGHAWLHHEHIGAFPYIPVLRQEGAVRWCLPGEGREGHVAGAQAPVAHHGSQGQASCSGRQLVAAAVSKSWA